MSSSTGVARSKGNASFRELSYRLSEWFEWVASIGLVGMLVATCIDVVGAKLFLRPLPGGYEMVSLLQVVAIASAIAFAKIRNLHINLELIVNLLPKRIRAGVNVFNALLGLGFFVLLGWKSFEYGLDFLHSGKVTSTAELPFYPFALWIAVCCIPISLLLLVDLLSSLRAVYKK
jgi:TRAP-type C4-dicarboxylate transport system permease small subunit